MTHFHQQKVRIPIRFILISFSSFIDRISREVTYDNCNITINLIIAFFWTQAVQEFYSETFTSWVTNSPNLVSAFTSSPRSMLPDPSVSKERKQFVQSLMYAQSACNQISLAPITHSKLYSEWILCRLQLSFFKKTFPLINCLLTASKMCDWAL